jgi:hypothetical protein
MSYKVRHSPGDIEGKTISDHLYCSNRLIAASFDIVFACSAAMR